MMMSLLFATCLQSNWLSSSQIPKREFNIDSFYLNLVLVIHLEFEEGVRYMCVLYISRPAGGKTTPSIILRRPSHVGRENS
jgi:hypothetical protein